MPFTFSHPAIVFPLFKLPENWISITGLVIGSMIPDFEYFLRMQVRSTYSHNWAGLFWFDLPLGLFIFFIYQTVVKNQLIDHLPTELNQRFSRFKGVGNNYALRSLFVIALSVLIGAVSHILWDGLSHRYGFFVLMIPSLANTIQLAGHNVYIYKIIQHTSSLIGAVAIVTVIFNLSPATRTQSSSVIGFWLQTTLIAAMTLFIRLETGLSIHKYGDVIVTIIAGALLGLIIASVIANMKRNTI